MFPGLLTERSNRLLRRILRTPNLYAVYPMQEDSGTVITDLGPNKLNGTYTGATLAQTGPLGGRAPSFD